MLGSLSDRPRYPPLLSSWKAEARTTGIHPVGWMGGTEYGLAWEVVTNRLGELAGHFKGEIAGTEAHSELRLGSSHTTTPSRFC